MNFDFDFFLILQNISTNLNVWYKNCECYQF